MHTHDFVSILAYQCICEIGWTGTVCDVNIDECTPDTDPCRNNAACIDLPGSYKCVCDPYWTDIHCDVDIIECSVPQCANNAECIEQIGGPAICNCLTGMLTDFTRNII